MALVKKKLPLPRVEKIPGLKKVAENAGKLRKLRKGLLESRRDLQASEDITERIDSAVAEIERVVTTLEDQPED